MEPIEVEFLAEKELISILPNFRMDRIYLISVRPLPCVVVCYLNVLLLYWIRAFLRKNCAGIFATHMKSEKHVSWRNAGI